MSDETLFKNHAKTFSLASFFFSKEDKQDVVAFYAFCRTVDDIADLSQNKEEAELTLASIKNGLRDGRLPDFPKMEKVMREKEIAPYYLIRLIESLEKDLKKVAIESLDELHHYCLGVASTVGVILCKILGPLPNKAVPHAIDLGIAMQLTNIVRDVYEDALSNKVYIPKTLLPKNFEASEILHCFGTPPINSARNKLLQEANHYYRSAERGYSFLPRRARFAIAAAAIMYEKIGCKCERNMRTKRASLNMLEKSFWGCSALLKVLKPPKEGNPARAIDFYQEMLSYYGSI